MDPIANQAFPSIKELISQSWSLCKKSILNLFFLNTFMLFVNVFLLIFMGLVGFFIILGGSLDKLNNPSTLTTLLLSPVTLIYFVICVLLSFIIGSIYRIAPTIFVSKADEKPGFFEVIKLSFSYIVPIILVSLISIFLVLGGYFVLIIPGLLFSFFLMFAPFEIVLANKKPLSAIRSSLAIVTSHFGEILIRCLLYIFAYIFFIVFIPQIVLKIEPSTYILLGFTSFITNMIFAWFGLAYSITIYNQAKKLTDETKSTSAVFMTITASFGWLIVILLIIFGFKSLSTKYGQAFVDSFKNSYKKDSAMNSPLTLTDVYNTLDNLTTKTIEFRANNNLSPMEIDQKLCAYAQRRLEQLRNNKGYDDNRGFFEDIANKEIGAAYFSNYSYLNNYAWTPISGNDSADLIFKIWTTGIYADKNKAIVANPDYTNFCYRGDLQSIVLVGGKKIQ